MLPQVSVLGAERRNRHQALLRLPILPLFNMPEGTDCHCKRKLQGGTRTTLSESHLLKCNGSKVMTTRHNAISNVIVDMVKSAKLAPIVEQLASEGHDARLRFDVSIDRVTGFAQNMKCDITVVNPLSTHLVAQAAVTPRSAADTKVTKKTDKYKQFLNQTDEFVPLVFETFGAVHPNVFHVVNTLSKRVANVPPPSATWTAPTFTAYWMQRLSCCLWRENARSIATIVAMTKNSYRTGASTSTDFAADFIPHQQQKHLNLPHRHRMSLPQLPYAHSPSNSPAPRSLRESLQTQALPMTTTSTSSTTTNLLSLSSGQAMSLVMRTQHASQIHTHRTRDSPPVLTTSARVHPHSHPNRLATHHRVSIPAHLDLGLLTPLGSNQNPASITTSRQVHADLPVEEVARHM
jgi:hypothetical protein